MESLALGISVDAKVGAAAGLFVLLGLLLISGVRHGLIRRELRQRKGWLVMPARELDPSKEEVSQFALMLGRARGAVQARLLRPSAAVRIHLQSHADGQVRYLLAAPRVGGLVVERAMYRQVELRRLDDPSAVLDPEALVPDADLLDPSLARLAKTPPDPLDATDPEAHS